MERNGENLGKRVVPSIVRLGGSDEDSLYPDNIPPEVERYFRELPARVTVIHKGEPKNPLVDITATN